MQEESIMTRGKLWTGLIVLFLAGTLTGIGGASFYQHYEHGYRWERGPAAHKERILTRLTEELSLTSAQQADIEPIVHQVHVEILRLRFQHHPEVEQILTKGIATLKTKLSADQQAKLERLYVQLQQRWQVSRDYLQAAQERR